MEKNPIVSLTGGLGNQLFQLAASQYFFQSGEIILEWGIGKPRLNTHGLPEIASFSLPSQIKLLRKRKFVWLMSKSTGYLLRMGVAPRGYEKSPAIKFAIRGLGSLITTAYFKEKRTTFASGSLGFTSEFPTQPKIFLIGYFQSYKWLEDIQVMEKMRALRPLHESHEIDFYKSLASKEKPLIVHIRLGDYKNSPDFGVLAPRYFVNQTNTMMKTGNYGKVWIFSDEIEVAKRYFSDFSPDSIRFIGEVNSSATETFEVMRFGSGYVISNSTYSWWSASLSYSSNPQVIAPSPWFKGMKEPEQLIAPSWTRIPAEWKEGE